MKATAYERAMNHWRNGLLAWNPKKYSYYKKNFYVGLAFSETDKMNAFYYDTDDDLEDRGVIYREGGIFNTPEYSYFIKIISKETLDNLTESDYNDIIIDFEHKIKQFKIKNKISELSKDFE